MESDLHPVTIMSITEDADGMCGCWQDDNDQWHCCEFHAGMDAAFDDELLAAAGYRLVRADDLRWLVDVVRWTDRATGLGAMDPCPHLIRPIPPGVRVLLDEMEA